ncbi:MAG: TetR family transcriptional regulator [Aeromicrobium sp.]|nr:TetR family transcriptional regulator [Aeromicrobium sp.]
MPARTDHDARRRDVAEAVWSVLETRGFAGLSLRSVAAQMGATTGLLTHYFPDKRALVAHALEQVHTRTDEALAGVDATPGLETLRTRLRAVLPTDDETRILSRIWVSFWDLALADPDLSAHEAARYDRWRARLRPHVRAAVRHGELAGNVETILDVLTAGTHGIVVQALFDPKRFTTRRQRAAIDLLLNGLRGRDATHHS